MRYPVQMLFLLLEHRFSKEFPELRIISKSESLLHRFIGWVLRFPWYPKKWAINPYYLTDYWTTIGYKIAHPKTDSADEIYSSWDILCHERVHVKQAYKYGRFLMGALYLLGTPVYLLLFCILSLLLLPLWLYISEWWISLILVCIGFLLSSPFPFGYFRAKFELEAYTVSMAITYWTTGRLTNNYIADLVKVFTGSNYFFMWPLKTMVLRWLTAARNSIKNGDIMLVGDDVEFYKKLYKTLNDWHLVRIETSKKE